MAHRRIMPLKHKNTKKIHTKNFVGFGDLVLLWQGQFYINVNVIYVPSFTI